MPDACDRCFWIKTHLKLPYQIFPGIFSSIDTYTKKAIGSYFNKHNRLPQSLSKIGHVKEILPSYHWSKFKYDIQGVGEVCGVPDDIYRLQDESLVLVDFKTAKFSGYQDVLFPIYKTQLNSYGLIAEKLGLGKVSSPLFLIYFSPKTEVTVDNVDNVVNDEGFLMNFEAKILPVELDLASIPPSMQRAKRIYDLERPPEGKDGCKECQKVDEMIAHLL